MQNILKEKGYKATPVRVEILRIFTENKSPLNAEDIHRIISKIKKLKNTNEATIYRNLSSLENGGILRKVELRKGSAYFELAQEHHHHIVCTSCNTIEDFENSSIEKALGRIVENSSGFKKVTEHSLELFGLCMKCLPTGVKGG